MRLFPAGLCFVLFITVRLDSYRPPQFDKKIQGSKSGGNIASTYMWPHHAAEGDVCQFS